MQKTQLFSAVELRCLQSLTESERTVGFYEDGVVEDCIEGKYKHFS